MYFVYILISTKFKGKTYVGFTSNLNARLIAHNHPQNKGYTKRFQPWSILYSEELNTKQAAMKREKYFTEKIKFEKQYSNIGSYWERNNQNEIDIVAINDLEEKVLIAEVKRNKDKISIDYLEEKAVKLTSKLQNYSFQYKGFSINDM